MRHFSVLGAPSCYPFLDLGWQMTTEAARVTCRTCKRTGRYRRRRRRVKGNG